MEVKQILNRFYVKDMNQAVEFYENLLNDKCKMRFKYQQVNLELAQVGNILIICGSDEALKDFKDTKATILVDSIFLYKEFLLEKRCYDYQRFKRGPYRNKYDCKTS